MPFAFAKQIKTFDISDTILKMAKKCFCQFAVINIFESVTVIVERNVKWSHIKIKIKKTSIMLKNDRSVKH